MTKKEKNISHAELPPAYDPQAVEGKWYRYWEAGGFFHAPDTTDRPPYCIVIPPPNITGVLHMGHALNTTLQDILIRWRRMLGAAALWLPGTDHAGIATQNVVEREILEQEGKRRHEIGRTALVDRIWKWREQYGHRILLQLKRIGTSCDWARTRFTLDDGLSRAVRECFVRLADEGLIYRGKYIVNWCPRCLTALADDEVEHEETRSHLWHLRYPLSAGHGFITVATTRPETMLGDTAVAVHPQDERYTALIGKRVRLPETDREIPIIADDFVDAAFGSGAVKVTPAHDPNDFAIGERHHLPRINVMNDDATMSDEAGKTYTGLTREACRKQLIAAFDRAGLLERIEDHTHAVGHCYRCHTVIEPRLSDQWFVKMRPLAQAAIRATREGKVRFHPERWTSFYLHWLENTRDWCISRQIWWGHRIPVWYCQSEKKCPPIAARETPTQCPHCQGTSLKQDDDVLDTWFSSALWPFSTLGWPEQTKALRTYYPTATLVTDRGIIYFWVARMVMMGLKCMHAVPFRDVYIHGTILDEQGRKMSKSLGNGIDPLDIIEQYGADAMRFSLVMLTTEGQDVKLSPTKFEMGRNFCNKLWNAARFTLMNLDEKPSKKIADKHLSAADRWILYRLADTTRTVNTELEAFHFHDAAQTLYRFVWNDFCDWYLEAAKPALFDKKDMQRRGGAQQTTTHVLATTLKLLHPFLPFITEEIGQSLQLTSLMIADYPRAAKKLPFAKEAAAFGMAQDIITAIRTIRAEHGVAPVKRIGALICGAEKKMRAIIETHRSLIGELARLETLDIVSAEQRPTRAATAVVHGLEILVPHAGLIDVVAEKARLEKEIAKVEAESLAVKQKLANQAFVANAPTTIVAGARNRLAEVQEKLAKLHEARVKLST